MSSRLGRLGVPERPDRYTAVIPTPSAVGSTDVTDCDREPISIPGSVQPHGALLLLDEADLTIRRVSANIDAFVGVPPAELLGAPLSRALTSDGAAVLAAHIAQRPEGRIGPVVQELSGLAGTVAVTRPCDLTLHRPTPGQLLLEIEETLATRAEPDLPPALLRLQAAPDLQALLDQTVVEVARMTGFERVMLYRFNADGDGEVVAEQLGNSTDSYLGLHYPGSDIPRQARDLYRRQWLRLIVSSDYVPVPLLPLEGSDGVGSVEPLDLSHAALRSVSPVHLQYLRNMGVASSMSMSLVAEDQLWGLILCHGTASHLVPSGLRTACEQLAQFVSLQVEARWETARLAAELRAQHLRTLLVDQMSAPDPVLGLVGGADAVDLLDVVPADAAAGRLAGRTEVVGDLLDVDTADQLVALIRATDTAPVGGCWSSGCLRADLPAAVQLLEGAGFPSVAGALLAPTPPGPTPADPSSDDYLLWVRHEVEQTVNWAGEPTVKHQSGSLSPRASFELWREKVRDRSEAWRSGDLEAAERLSDAVVARLGRLDEMDLASAAARNAELFAREHEIADTLQRGMLPMLPVLPHLTLSASYVSASESAEVGGDWYDVFTLPDGSIGIAMGDVTGHDLSAAATMGQLRSVLRSYAWEETAPELVLDKVDALVSGFSMQRMATVFFGRLQRGSGGDPTFSYANAGHLPPLLRLPDGSVELLDSGVSVLIGVGLGIRHEAASRRIPPGSTLLLYTDGLVEARDRPVGEGIDALRQVVADGPRGTDALREHVLARMVPGHRSDDIAVLVVAVDS